MSKIKIFLLVILLSIAGCTKYTETTDNNVVDSSGNKPTSLGELHIATKGGVGITWMDTTCSVPTGADSCSYSFDAMTDGGYGDFVAVLSLKVDENDPVAHLINAEYINFSHNYRFSVAGADSVRLYISLFCDGGGQEPCVTCSYFDVTNLTYTFTNSSNEEK